MSAPRSDEYKEAAQRWGKKLKRICVNCKMTQKELAKRIGMHQGTLSRLMRGDNIPDLEVGRKIVLATGIDPSWLFSEEDEIEEELESMIKGMSLEEKKRMINLVKNVPFKNIYEDKVISSMLGITQGN